MVWSANIYVFVVTCCHPLSVFILNDVVTLAHQAHRTLTQSITAKFILISKCLGVEVDPLGQVGEQHGGQTTPPSRCLDTGRTNIYT